jgi:PAS domain S-box-containing protein
MAQQLVKVLLIDDSPSDRSVFRRYLESISSYMYQLAEEDYGKNGVITARAFQPDCILVDFHLPDADGLEVVRQIRQQAETVDTPVIVLTGGNSEKVAVAAIQEGVSDFLLKDSVTIDSLHYAILQAIEKAALHKIIKAQTAELTEKKLSLEQALASVQQARDDLEVRVVERTRELQSLNNALQLQAQVLTAMHEGVVVLSAEGRIVLTNIAFDEMFGYQPGELIGGHIDILNAGTPVERTGITNTLLREVQAQGTWRGRLQECRKDGTMFPSLVRMSNVQIADQHYIVSLHEDITEREILEAKAREQESLAQVGSTAVRLTHEIGNRLNGLSTTTQLLERHLRKQTAPDVSLLSETVSNLKSDINRMIRFLQDLRTLARAYRLNVTPVNVIPLIYEVLQSAESRCRSSGVNVVTDLPASSTSVYADSERCREVLQRIVDNAVEAMPAGGTLTVASVLMPHRVRISIRDTGPGIPQDLDIFAPFISTKPGGTGLGLTIALQLVVAQQGSLTFSSSPSQGTVFMLELPSATGLPTGEGVDNPRQTPSSVSELNAASHCEAPEATKQSLS